MTVSILDALDDPALLGAAIRDPGTFAAWRVFLSALFGLPIADGDRDLFRACTGRTEAPTESATEAFAICGRRSRKTLTLSLVAVFLAAFREWRHVLGPGERGTVMLIAADRKQARIAMRYVKAALKASPMLRRLIERETAEAIDLSNGVSIEIQTASFRTVRGYTILAVLLDEAAFFRSDDGAAEPDREIIDALRPGMATVPGAMLLVASSPYAKRGILWDARKRHFGVNGDRALVWQASTQTMNPNVAQSVVDDAIERDAAVASSEWLAEFRNDIESFVAREVVQRCVEPGVTERAFAARNRYIAFCDPSGGSNDSMTLAIAHREGDRALIDVTRERRAPFSPESVVQEFCDVLARYGITAVRGDRYAGEWPAEQFKKRGITYESAEKSKSDLYRELLPALNTGALLLLDDARIVNQISNLERRTARGGRDSIDHAPGAHDDLANAVAGAAWHAGAAARRGNSSIGFIGGDGSGPIAWQSDDREPPRVERRPDGVLVLRGGNSAVTTRQPGRYGSAFLKI